MKAEPLERRFMEKWLRRANEQVGLEVAQREWVSFIKDLDQRANFQWFTTLTFREPTHPESAMKAYRRWEHQINRKVYGVRYTRRNEGISSVVAIEFQKRGVLHFHALNAGLTVPPTREVDLNKFPKCYHVNEDGSRQYRRMTAMDSWFEMAGIARIWEFRRGGGAEAYVSKYILKSGGDIFLTGSFCPKTPSLRRMSTEEGREE